MYRCSICKIAIIVRPGEIPIRACNCTEKKVIDGNEIIKLSTIVMDMGEAMLVSHGKLQ